MPFYFLIYFVQLNVLTDVVGGNFGIITQYRLKTYHITKVVYFKFTFSNNDIISVFDSLQRVCINTPYILSGIVGNR